jgi:serine/threonine protein kinase
MPLTAGAHLGSYEILAAIGAGGMGEVYRARDTRLNRDVALKILPDAFTHDPERVARFRREAHVLAALNHPHIAAIYGLDEANGSQFLVLELVDGESLDKRTARGPIPVAEAPSCQTTRRRSKRLTTKGSSTVIGTREHCTHQRWPSRCWTSAAKTAGR